MHTSYVPVFNFKILQDIKLTVLPALEEIIPELPLKLALTYQFLSKKRNIYKITYMYFWHSS